VGRLVPDALITLSRLIASLHDDAGNVAVEGLHSGPAADVDYPEERLRAESGHRRPGVEWIGDGSAVERLWTKPALSITGLDAPKVDGASNTLVPAARAKISPAHRARRHHRQRLACLSEHLEKPHALGRRSSPSRTPAASSASGPRARTSPS
jgi:hypothetical protein